MQRSSLVSLIFSTAFWSFSFVSTLIFIIIFMYSFLLLTWGFGLFLVHWNVNLGCLRFHVFWGRHKLLWTSLWELLLQPIGMTYSHHYLSQYLKKNVLQLIKFNSFNDRQFSTLFNLHTSVNIPLSFQLEEVPLTFHIKLG